MPEGADSWTAVGWPGAHTPRAWATLAGHRPCSCWGRGSCPLRRSRRRPADHGSRPQAMLGALSVLNDVHPKTLSQDSDEHAEMAGVRRRTPQQCSGCMQGLGTALTAHLAAGLASRGAPLQRAPPAPSRRGPAPQQHSPALHARPCTALHSTTACMPCQVRRPSAARPTCTQKARASTSALLRSGRQVPKASETTARQAASSLDAMTDWKNVQVFCMHAGAAPAAGLASYVTTCMPHAML